jgi:site-specific DNA recombinase
MKLPVKPDQLIRKLRCAIYTRKSTEEGLEQEFNSLHAQRDACEAYIASQRSEGWVLVRDQYDDGGVSGGACWLTSRRGWSMWWWSTRLTGYPAR